MSVALPTSPADSPARRRARALAWPRVARWLLLLLYAAIVLAVRAHHEPWRDELETWVMARDAPARVLLEACSFSGHPPLWYLVNLVLARPGWLPIEAQGIAHVAIAIATMALLLLRGPFPLRWLVPLVFSVHFLYQYAVVARGYSLLFLMMFLACDGYRERLARPRRYAGVLALLLQTEVFGWAFGGALAVFFLHDLRTVAVPAPAGLRRVRRQAAAIVVLGGLLAVGSMVRWNGVPGKNDGLRFGPLSLPYALSEGFFPLDAYGPQLAAAFGEPAARVAAALPRLPFALVGLAIAGCSLLALPPRSRAALVLAASLAWLGAILVFKYHGFFWHHGLFVPFLLAGGWLAIADRTAPPRHAWQRIGGRVAGLCLAAAAVTWPVFAAGAIAFDIKNAYSAGPAAAAYLQPRISPQRPVLAFGCHGLVATTAHLPRGTVWMALIERRANHTLWDYHMGECFARGGVDPEYLLRRHRTRVASQPGSLVLTDFAVAAPALYHLEPVFARGGSWESFFVYRVLPRGGSPPAGAASP